MRLKTFVSGAVLTAAAPIYPAYDYLQNAHEGNARMALVELDRARTKRAAIAVYANNGELIAHLYGGRIERMDNLGMDSSLRLTKLELEKNYRYAVAAAVALEDQAFYESPVPGLNLKGVLRAAKTNIEAGEIKEGGSSIADQVCGAMRENPNTKSTPKTKLEKIKKKLDDMSCGIALQSTNGADQTMNDYLSFTYLGEAYGVKAAALRYWNTNHPSIAQQVMLAAMIRHPYDGSSQTLEEKIKPRTRTGLKILKQNGTLTAAEYQAAIKELNDMEVVSIERAKELQNDKTGSYIPEGPVQKVSLLNDRYEPVVTMAIEEIKEAFKGSNEPWYSQTAQLVLTIDPDAQAAAHKNTEYYLSKKFQPLGGQLHPNSVVTFLNYNEEGEILAFYGDMSELADPEDRKNNRGQLWKYFLETVLQAGSVNKLLLTAAAPEAYDPNKFGHNDFRTALAFSNSQNIYNAAIDIGIKYENQLTPIAKCYGTQVNGEYGYIPNNADDYKANSVGKLAFGWFHSTNEQKARILPEALTGKALPDLHTIKYYTLKNGSKYAVNTSPSQERETCAQLIHNKGITETWIDAPIRDGFLKSLDGAICYGKTGTISKESLTGDKRTNTYTNMVSKSCEDDSYLTVSFGRPNGDVDRNLPVSTQSAAYATYNFYTELNRIKRR